MSLAISLSGVQVPECEEFDQWTPYEDTGLVDWGDGSPVETWTSTSGATATRGKSFAGRTVVSSVGLPHTYKFPGRWRVKLSFEWNYGLPADCENAHGVVTTWVTVDVLPNPALIANGAIGTFFDSGATVCSAPAPIGTVLYVIAALAGQSADGITGAEFRLRSHPPGGFLFAEEAPTGWIKVGNAFGNGISLGTGCTGAGGSALLLRITAFPLSNASDVTLIVDRHLAPTNPSYTTPMFVLCDTPVFTATTAGQGFAAVLDPSDGPPSPCASGSVRVAPGSWSQVKELYRR
jgi:hypothetical protein